MKQWKRQSQRVRAEDIEGGELVTRADGSQAIKVRKRKRRTHQPKKKSKKKSIGRGKIIFFSSLVVLLILSGIGFAFLLGYYNGSRFEKKVEDSITANTGAKAEITRMQMSLGKAKISKIELNWDNERFPIQRIEAKGLKANYGIFSFLGGGWLGSELQAATANVKLRLLDTEPDFSLSGEPPVDYSFESYLGQRVDVDFDGSRRWAVSEITAILEKNDDDESQIYVNNGTLLSPIGEFAINNGILRFNEHSVDLSLQVKPLNKSGTIELKGDVGYKKGDKVTLKSTFKRVAMDGWIDRAAKRLFDGEITQGDGTVSFYIGENKDFEMSTKVTSNLIRISNFAFIDDLSLLLSDDYFISPRFTNGATALVRFTGEKTRVSDLNLVEKDQFKVQGYFELQKSGELTGEFKIGISMDTIPKAKEKLAHAVFTENDGIFIWTKVKLSGTASSPTDDLQARIEAAEVEIKNAQEKLEQNLKREDGDGPLLR